MKYKHRTVIQRDEYRKSKVISLYDNGHKLTICSATTATISKPTTDQKRDINSPCEDNCTRISTVTLWLSYLVNINASNYFAGGQFLE